MEVNRMIAATENTVIKADHPKAVKKPVRKAAATAKPAARKAAPAKKESPAEKKTVAKKPAAKKNK